jgi:hypothetical protein
MYHLTVVIFIFKDKK